MTCPWHVYLSFSFWYTLERTHDKIYPIFCLLKKSSEYSIDSMNFKKNYISKSGGNRMDHIFDKNIFSVRDTVGKMKDNIFIKIRQKLHIKSIKKTQKFNEFVYIFWEKMWNFHVFWSIWWCLVYIEFLSNFERNIIV